MATANNLLDWALWYASNGWAVLPVWGVAEGVCQCGQADCKSPGKHPQSHLAPRGVKDATLDESTIRRWFESNPHLNIGIATGQVSGLVVMDVDGEEGHAIVDQNGLSSTPTVSTGRGHHHYLAYEPGHKSRAGVLAKIDIRTDGGYVVAPPSRHVSGHPYGWVEHLGPHDQTLAAVPPWLQEASKNSQRQDKKPVPTTFAEGMRNSQLTSIAGKMRRDGADVAAIQRRLEQLNEERCVPELSTREVASIAESVGGYPAGGGVALEEALAPLLELPTDAAPPEIEHALREVSQRLQGSDAIRHEMAMVEAKRLLAERGVAGHASLVKTALAAGQARDDVDPHASGKQILLSDPVPSADPVAGGSILDQIVALLRRYVILPTGADVGVALWVLHTYVYDARNISPRLAITSPEKRCAKTLLLEILQNLVRRPLPASNVTSAMVFRVIEAHSPTLLIDEADTFLAERSELRGVLNAGHSKSFAQVLRLVGDNHEPRAFSVWGAAAIGMIGNLPSTLEDRSVTILMRRRKDSEHVERIHPDRLAEEADAIRSACARWAQDNLEELRELEPERPAWLDDRACDNWGILFSIAALCGKEWLERAFSAARALSASRDEGDGSARVQLLGDLRVLFSSRGVDRLPTSEILDHLHELEDRPWAEWNRGRPMTAQALAKLLKPFGVLPRSIRMPGGSTPKGYPFDRFKDAFERYLDDDHTVPSPKQPPLPM